jgi:serine/threonine protein kinase/tetratricopeptide (TPR) repeat protein
MEEVDWVSVNRVFDLLLDGADLESTLAAEPDEAVRAAALDLWQHHLSASNEDYLSEPLAFEVTTMFRPGQMLQQRFRIERLLGSGGMGEVYLAWDELMEGRVALKTIARLLAPSESIRRRFLAEVRNAQRVTHPNVCRIHALFEEGETAFFTMEYLEGIPLSEAAPGLTPRQRASVLMQMAQGLRAAHSKGVIHGDLKPSNAMVSTPEPGSGEIRAVIMDFGLARAADSAGSPAAMSLSLRAGTAEYMAPELLEGQPPTIHSDIFAFGQMGRELLPKERIWEECTRSGTNRRPDSIEAVIRHLDPARTRRFWLTGLGAIAAGGLGYAAWPKSGMNAALPANARILINGFRTASDTGNSTGLVRSFLLASLQQSSRIRTIEDPDLHAALRKLAPRASLPLSGSLLGRLAERVRAAFWIEGELRHREGRYFLDARIFDAGRQQPVAASVLGDAPSLIAVAEAAAMWVRKTAGESAGSLEANSGSLARFASAVPEAVEHYYQALEYRNQGDTGLAIEALNEAIRLDPRFAQAHHTLGLSKNALRQYEEGFREIETAKQLADRLPEREQVPIALNYYRMTEDYPQAIRAAQRAMAIHPDEPRYHAALGQMLAWTGRAADGADEIRRAVNLAPNDAVWYEFLGDALVEAGQFEGALSEYRLGLLKDPEYTSMHSGMGDAYRGLEKYDEALEEYRKEPKGAEGPIGVLNIHIMRGDFDIAVAACQERLARARDVILARHHALDFLSGLYFTTDRASEARKYAGQMAELTSTPTMGSYVSCAASWARRTGEDSALAHLRETADETVRRWPNDFTTAVALHVEGLQAWREGDLDRAALVLLRSSGLSFDVWTQFDLAEFYTVQGKWDLAETYWEAFHANRGTVIAKNWFPGLLPMGWTYRAVAAKGRKDGASASRYARKVLDHWSKVRPLPEQVRTAAAIYAATRV